MMTSRLLRWIGSILLVMVTLAAAGCPAPPAPSPVAPVVTDKVTLNAFAFQPQVIKVAVGTTVTWTNNDTVAHTIAARDNSFTSASLPNGATYTFKFDKKGTYDYICGIHPYMTAQVIVE